MDEGAAPDRPPDREVACSPDVGSVDDSFESASDESDDGRRSLAASPESQSIHSDDFGSKSGSRPASKEEHGHGSIGSTATTFDYAGARDLGAKEGAEQSSRRPNTVLSERPGSVASVDSIAQIAERPDTVGSLAFIDEVDQLAASVDSLRPESVESLVRPGSAESWEDASDSNAGDVAEDDDNIGGNLNMDSAPSARKDDNFLANLDDVGDFPEDGDEIEDGVRFFGIDDKNKENSLSPVRRSASTPLLPSPTGPTSLSTTTSVRHHGSYRAHGGIQPSGHVHRGVHRF
jgi:hypothetical protein